MLSCLSLFLKLPPVPRGIVLDLYVLFMITLNFAPQHRHFISYFSGTHILFLCGLLTRKNFSSIIPHSFSFLSRSLRLEPRRLKFSLDHVFSVLREFLAQREMFFYSIEDHHSLISSSRTPKRLVCYKIYHVITSRK